MLDAALEFAAWWDALGPEWQFLFALPFAVALVALAADVVRRRTDLHK